MCQLLVIITSHLQIQLTGHQMAYSFVITEFEHFRGLNSEYTQFEVQHYMYILIVKRTEHLTP